MGEEALHGFLFLADRLPPPWTLARRVYGHASQQSCPLAAASGAYFEHTLFGAEMIVPGSNGLESVAVGDLDDSVEAVRNEFVRTEKRRNFIGKIQAVVLKKDAHLAAFGQSESVEFVAEEIDSIHLSV